MRHASNPDMVVCNAWTLCQFTVHLRIRLPRRFFAFLTVFQSVLLLVHGFLFLTWVYFWSPLLADQSTAYDFRPQDHLALLAAMVVLAVSFLATSLIAFRTTNIVLRFFYRLAAEWLGFVSFAFFASLLCWITYFALELAHVFPPRSYFALAFLALAVAFTAYGVLNASWTRINRITVKLPSLPASWRGRSAVLVSDVHLGNVRGRSFTQRIVKAINQLNPHVVFIDGDLFDGTPADFANLIEPLRTLHPQFGTFFVEGNHEEFTDHTKFVKAIAATGVRVLNNERVELDGLQLLGVAYKDATHGEHFRKTLRQTGFDRARASILLTHAPDRPAVSAEEGVSLQLSGHTHSGQFWPWTLAAKRMYGKYVYGLQTLGAMQIYTSYGAGTWGPPLRLGSNSEIVAIRFE
jgi:predicted MPP superfamily phosphohydrolase